MKKTNLISLKMLITLIIISPLYACGNDKNDKKSIEKGNIIGVWEAENNPTLYETSNVNQSLEFTSQNAGHFIIEIQQDTSTTTPSSPHIADHKSVIKCEINQIKEIKNKLSAWDITNCKGTITFADNDVQDYFPDIEDTTAVLKINTDNTQISLFNVFGFIEIARGVEFPSVQDIYTALDTKDEIISDEFTSCKNNNTCQVFDIDLPSKHRRYVYSDSANMNFNLKK